MTYMISITKRVEFDALSSSFTHATQSARIKYCGPKCACNSFSGYKINNSAFWERFRILLAREEMLSG